MMTVSCICRFVRIYAKVWNLVETLHYFTTRGWDFQTKALVELWDQMSTDDREVCIGYYIYTFSALNGTFSEAD